MSRIGLDLRMMGVGHGGIGRYAAEVFKRVVKTDTQNQYVVFYRPLLTKEEDLKEFAGCELVPVEARHYSVSEQTLFLRKLNQAKLDLVHFPNFNVPILYKGKFVVTIHDVIHHKIGGAKKSHFLHFLAYKKIISQAALKSSAIITVSEYSKKEIVKALGAEEEKIAVTYEGASLNPDLALAAETVKSRYYLDKPYFLFVGVLERKKNLINLTRGFDEFLKKTKLNMDLVIVGKKDPHYPNIRYKAMDITYKNHLVFTDFATDVELAGLYSQAHAFVSASIYEGFGLPGVDALQFNLPLVVSNIEVFNEIYDNAAIYFDPLSVSDIAEKLALIASDSGLHSQLQINSANRKSFFDWEKTARQTLEVYERVLNI